MKTLSIAALLALSGIARADVFLTRNVHTDATTSPKGDSVPAKDEVQTSWIGKDKVRAELNGVAYIVRLDQKKMYIVNAGAKTYSVVDLPFDVSHYVPEGDKRAYDALSDRIRVSATVQASDETERVHGWGAKKFTVQVRYPSGGSADTVWTTTDIEVDSATYWGALSSVFSLRPGGAELVDELKKTQGITVKADHLRTIGALQVHSTEELATVERKDAPAGTYDVPSDFKETPYNAIQYLRMALGPLIRAEEAAAGGDGSKSGAPSGKRGGGEEKPSEGDKGGDKRKRPGG